MTDDTRPESKPLTVEQIAELMERDGMICATNETINRAAQSIHSALPDHQELVEALKLIVSRDWFENTLDPQWPAQVARAALAKYKGE